MPGKPAFIATTGTPTIHVGARVTIRLPDGTLRSFTIVDRNGIPETGSISSASPLGKALLANQSSGVTSYQVNGKLVRIEIVEIEGK